MEETIAKLSANNFRKLAEIAQLDNELAAQFNGRLRTQPSLTRQLVSFQANKDVAAYRWYKYKEAFSASLVEYLLLNHKIPPGPILDPFAGMGTTLFASAALGFDADGIELLPIGQQIIRSRLAVQNLSRADRAALRRWLDEQPWNCSCARGSLPVLRITNGAYPEDTVGAIERYMGAWEDEKDRVRRILQFALLCILESVSYTRKDGQYLRWDHRSGRRQGTKPFNKGRILPFDEAITKKLREILADTADRPADNLFAETIQLGKIKLLGGSCLDVLPSLAESNYSAIITSPPYCNRYDYTRTYALELALLGVTEKELVALRQQMLSCTVENRAKNLLAMNPDWARAVDVADGQVVLQAILQYLEGVKEHGQLNNNGIPRMVRGYFYEMACVIRECARVLKRGGLLFMVNDNVRYAGASIPVDLILSDLAQKLGFSVPEILVLPIGKGNSSQQMGAHGRDQLRKCVYVWRRNGSLSEDT